MKVHRFIGKFNLDADVLLVDEEEIVHQMRSVLKLKVGEQVILGDGDLNEVRAEILEFTRQGVQLNILERMINNSEYDRKVVLYCSILKKENFELVVQKATELGVSEIVPVISARTIKLDLRYDRLEKIIREAGEQSGRGRLPILHQAVELEEALQNASGQKLFFDGSGESMGEVSADAVSIFIGPEGGWSGEEIQMAKDSGFSVVSLGKLTLRAETASIVSIAHCLL